MKQRLRNLLQPASGKFLCGYYKDSELVSDYADSRDIADGLRFNVCVYGAV